MPTIFFVKSTVVNSPTAFSFTPIITTTGDTVFFDIQPAQSFVIDFNT
jgi:hypothetical protein